MSAKHQNRAASRLHRLQVLAERQQRPARRNGQTLVELLAVIFGFFGLIAGAVYGSRWGVAGAVGGAIAGAILGVMLNLLGWISLVLIGVVLGKIPTDDKPKSDEKRRSE